MKTLILKVEVPDQISNNEIEVTIPGARVKAEIITPPTEEEIDELLPEIYDEETGQNFKAKRPGAKWLLKRLGL